MSEMRLVTPMQPVTVDELTEIAEESFGDLVKAVVDIDLRIMAIGGELHADEENLLMGQGSTQSNLWGINLYPAEHGTEDWLEYDSMINIRPAQKNRSRSVEDPNPAGHRGDRFGTGAEPMTEPPLHSGLAGGRWQTLSLVEQLGNIGSEAGRAVRAKTGGNQRRMEAALDRALELFDLTIADPRWTGRLKEILRAREVLCDFLICDNAYGSSAESFDRYFLPFAVAARRSVRDGPGAGRG